MKKAQKQAKLVRKTKTLPIIRGGYYSSALGMILSFSYAIWTLNDPCVVKPCIWMIKAKNGFVASGIVFAMYFLLGFGVFIYQKKMEVAE